MGYRGAGGVHGRCDRSQGGAHLLWLWHTGGAGVEDEEH